MLPKRANLAQLASTWDLVVVGGGITGAGVAMVAAQQGINVLLVEQRDYAWGTSSRSSKMVHGGLRYLAQGAIGLTRESLKERERLRKELPELVKPMDYYFPVLKGQFPGPIAMGIALWCYDWLAGVRETQWHNRSSLKALWPQYEDPRVQGAYCYTDALTDDSRLVLRVLQEASAHGAEIMNYVSAQEITALEGGANMVLQDHIHGHTKTIRAKQVINATGAWADTLSATQPKIRPLRGSHLVLRAESLPISACLTLLHPADKRPVFVFPWRGSIVVGTTDQDHHSSLQEEPKASASEVAYLLEALRHAFPSVSIRPEQIVSTQAGVRPVIASGKGKDPSKERRNHLVWQGPGRINVSGGKLTTFRLIALDTLKAAGFLDAPRYRRLRNAKQVFTHSVSWPKGLGDPLAPLPTEETLLQWWRWAIRHEHTMHLDDLLLRRTHVGQQYADGAMGLLHKYQLWLCAEFGWSEQRWQKEQERYQNIWQRYYQE